MYEYKYSDKEMLPNPTFEKAYLMILQFTLIWAQNHLFNYL